MMESAVQMPDLIQIAIGGKRMASKPRKMSLEHMAFSEEEVTFK